MTPRRDCIDCGREVRKPTALRCSSCCQRYHYRLEHLRRRERRISQAILCLALTVVPAGWW